VIIAAKVKSTEELIRDFSSGSQASIPMTDAIRKDTNENPNDDTQAVLSLLSAGVQVVDLFSQVLSEKAIRNASFIGLSVAVADLKLNVDVAIKSNEDGEITEAEAAAIAGGIAAVASSAIGVVSLVVSTPFLIGLFIGLTIAATALTIYSWSKHAEENTVDENSLFSPIHDLVQVLSSDDQDDVYEILDNPAAVMEDPEDFAKDIITKIPKDGITSDTELRPLSMEGVIDLRQVKSLFVNIDSTLSYSDIEILLDASGKPGEQMDNLANHLKAYFPTSVSQSSLPDITRSLREGREQNLWSDHQVISLGQYSQDQIYALSKFDNDLGRSVRYAMLNGASFAFDHNFVGSEVAGSKYDLENFSEAYLFDLSRSLVIQLNDNLESVHIETDISVTDLETGYENIATNNVDNLLTILFGSSENDVLSGEIEPSHLYGREGNDTLQSGEGNDYLEGGSGDDTYEFIGYFGRDVVYDDGGVIKIDGQVISEITFKEPEGNLYSEFTVFEDSLGNKYLETDDGFEVYVDTDISSGTVIVKGNLEDYGIEVKTETIEVPDLEATLVDYGNSLSENRGQNGELIVLNTTDLIHREAFITNILWQSSFSTFPELVSVHIDLQEHFILDAEMGSDGLLYYQGSEVLGSTYYLDRSIGRLSGNESTNP
jgi:hypothetical protein